MTTDKLLDKLRKLKAHAESAEKIGSEAEAQAFAAMFQKLLLDNKLEMSDLEFEEMEREQPVEKKFIDYREYPDIPVKHARVAWMERLASVVARAHFCRILVHSGRNYITLVGRRDDIAVAEYMFITLTRAAERLAKKAHAAYCWEVYKRNGSCSAARGFKAAFTQAFIMRLAQRYEEEKAARIKFEQAASGVTCTALVRINKAEQDVADYMKQFTKSAGRLTVQAAWHSEGTRRGVAAANAIELRANALRSDGQRRRELT